MSKKLFAAGTLALAAAMSLTACTPPSPGETKNDGATNVSTQITAMWNQPFYSLNPNTQSGNNVTNSIVSYVTSDGFVYYDKDAVLQKNESFGKYEKISDDPLTIKLTLADTAQWSDGVPVTADDIMLTFGAVSGSWNTISDEKARDTLYTGKEKDVLNKTEGDTVYFEAGSAQWQLIKDFPQFSAEGNGKEFTYTFSKKYNDWEHNLLGVGLPAHIVGKRALGIDDPTAAKKAVSQAFQNKDNTALAKIANVWNLDYNFKEMPADKDLLVTNGPFIISEMKKEQYITFTPNPNYKGSHKPSYGKLILRYGEDANAAVQALRNGEVDIIAPQATADVLSAVQGIPNANVMTSIEASYEHIDLTFNNGGPFDPEAYGGDAEKAKKVRKAFLQCIPREQIVEKLIKPINPNAEVRNSFNVIPNTANYDFTVETNKMAEALKLDLEASKTLLKEAGASNPTVRFMYAKDNQRRAQLFQLVKESCDQAGFKVVAMPDSDWSSHLGNKSYDAVTFAWSSTSMAVGESDANYRTGGLNNFSAYSNKEVDALYDKLTTETDADNQKQIIADVEKHLVDDAFGTVIFQFPGITTSASKISGVAPAPLSPSYFWNYWEWKVGK